MSDILTKEEEAQLYKQMLRKQLFFHSMSTICMAAVVSCANISVGSLGPFEKACLLAGILGLWGDKMAVFYGGLLKGLTKGKAPGEGEGDTQLFTKDQIPLGAGLNQIKTEPKP